MNSTVAYVFTATVATELWLYILLNIFIVSFVLFYYQLFQ